MLLQLARVSHINGLIARSYGFVRVEHPTTGEHFNLSHQFQEGYGISQAATNVVNFSGRFPCLGSHFFDRTEQILYLKYVSHQTSNAV